MSNESESSPIELQVRRVRELSTQGRHDEALAAAEALALAAPHDRDVVYLIAANQRCLNRITQALATLRYLEQQHPRFSLLYQERGHCYTALHDPSRAIDAFQKAVKLNPALPKSWSMLERLYRMKGDERNASTAAEHLAAIKQLAPEVVQAGSLFSDGDLSAAENILRDHVRSAGNHAEAFRLLGRIQHQLGELAEAESLLEMALQLAPNYLAARLDYARVLLARQKYPQAHEEIDALLKLEPGNQDYLSLQAAACVGLGRHEHSIVLYRQLLAASPGSGELHLALGHCLKSLGKHQEAIDSYKAALAIRPSFGDGYWSLANLKTYPFSEDEIATMRAQEIATTGPADRYHLCFALGKAYEDRKDYSESWQFYERGNQLKRLESRYDAEIFETKMRKQIALCTAQFFTARVGVGAPDDDPIFIVGLPRSGSTLLEQILASHSQVEGTQELYDVQRIALDIRVTQANQNDLRYPDALADLAPEQFRALGERYITDTCPYRTDKPHFIDKMPNNFRHIGLIHLMLPNAKVIDMRREPMACCFSNLKQLFASGQEFTYSVEDIARYYRTYLDLMRHWDAVLPGRILRVIYEDLVEDLRGSVRRVLEFCGLKFEPACVAFHKTERSVRTPSSEQVRQPIFRAGLDQWRNYEPWLDQLKSDLGDALGRYGE